jgi:hypothetical protein
MKGSSPPPLPRRFRFAAPDQERGSPAKWIKDKHLHGQELWLRLMCMEYVTGATPWERRLLARILNGQLIAAANVATLHAFLAHCNALYRVRMLIN